MAAGDINDPLTNIPNVVLVDQTDASAAPGAGYGRLEVVDGVLGVRVGTGAWVALVSLVAGLLTSLTEKVTPADTDLLLLQDEAAASALKKVQVGNLPGGGDGGGLWDALVVVQDQQAQNTNGGDAVSGAWRTRTLNTEVVDTAAIATLASNEVTLPAGTYDVWASAPAYYCGSHQLRLYNVTGDAVLVTGQSSFAIASGGYYPLTHAPLVGTFTLAGQSAVRLEHQVETTNNGQGFGRPCNFTTEVYASLEVRRRAA